MLTQKQKLHFLVVLTAVIFISLSGTDIYISALPSMVSALHTTPSVVNLTLAIYNIGIAVGVLFAGEFSNKFGRKNTIMCGTILFGSAALLIGVMNNIYIIICIRFIQSLGCAIMMIVPRLILKDYLSEKEQITANATLFTSLVISPALSPIIGSFISSIYGWRYCFFFTATISYVLLLVEYLVLKETLLEKHKNFYKPSEYLSLYYKFLTNPIFISLTLIFSCGLGSYYAFIGMSSYLYINFWHMAQTHYSVIFLLVAIAYLIGNQVLKHINENNLMLPMQLLSTGIFISVFGMILILLSLLFNSFALNLVLVTIGVLLIRAANAFTNTSSQVKIINYFGKDGGMAIGLSTSISFIITALSMYLSGLFSFMPYFGLVLVSLLFIIICCGIYIFNYRKLHLID